MFKCLECGHIFEPGEEMEVKEDYGLPGGYYDKLAVCPVCGGDFEETMECQKCHGAFSEEALFDGLCLACVSDEMDYDTMLQYMIDKDYFTQFMFEKYFNSSMPETVSKKLHNSLVRIFNNEKMKDIYFKKKFFYNMCKRFILVDDGIFGIHDFAEWLNRKDDDNAKEKTKSET